MREIVFLYLVLSAQFMFNSFSESFNIDFFAIFVILLGLRKGAMPAVWLGALGGFIVDIHSQTLFGINFVSYAILGGLVGFFSVKNWYLNYKLRLLISLIAIFVLYVSKIFMSFIFLKNSFSFLVLLNRLNQYLGTILLTFIFVNLIFLVYNNEST